MAGAADRLSAALVDRYRVECELGAGGMATVYLAHDVRHDRKVAIKVLKPELAAVLGAERFVVEIKTTAALSHPHILPLFDSGTADGFLYYVMPFIKGETIREKLNRETQFGVDEAVRIAREVADALDYAHRNGVIHRDIKPENILLHDGRAMVMDFGIALAVSAAAGGRMTETGLSLGTPHYMSPEQATADKDLTPRSDIYSLGSVLYEMLSGEPPHTGGSAQQVIMKIIADTPRPVHELRRNVPPNVSAAIARAVEKVPADRFESARAFSDALANPAFSMTAAGHVSPGRSSGAMSRFLPWAVAAVGIALGVTGWLIPRRATQRDSAVVRYEVPSISTSVAETGIGNPIALSPDGRYLAATSTDAQGLRTLMLKSASQTRPDEVEGSRGARDPFFSPDGKWIAFYANGRLWKASIAGGGAALLADARAGRSSWSSKGFIVQSSSERAGGELVRMPETGGAWEKFTTRDSSAGETGQLAPIVLADGETILYRSLAAGGAGASRIGVAALSSGRSRILPVLGAYVLGVVDDYLIFATAAGELMSVEFDIKSWDVKGTPIALGAQAQVDLTGQAFAALSGHGDLTIMIGSSVRQLVIVPENGASVRVPLDAQDIKWPRLSPDGKRIAMTVSTGGHSDIWIYDLPQGPLTRLTNEGQQNDRPEWMPDGRSVLFRSSRGVNNAIWVQPVDSTGNARLLYSQPAAKVDEGVVSPDGKFLLFQMDSTGIGDLWYTALAPDSQHHPVATSAGAELSARFSPDGKWIAYTSSESGPTQVYVRPFPSLATRHQVSLDGGATPVWSRDGLNLYYVVGRALLRATFTSSPTFAVLKRRVVSENVLSYQTIHADYDLFPDGRVIGLQRTEDDNRLVMVHNWAVEVRARLSGRRQ